MGWTAPQPASMCQDGRCHKPLDATDGQAVFKIARPDPSWIPIRFSPYHYQAVFSARCFGMSFHSGPLQIPESLIDDVVFDNVKDPSIRACRIDRGPFQFMIEDSHCQCGDELLVHRHVDPFDVRQQLNSHDGMIDPAAKRLVDQIEAVWATMEIRFRRAHRYGHCRLLARAGSPHAFHFTEIPPDVFVHYRLIDWRHGIANASTGSS